ncbi:unnamed protein product [Tuber aestivum]|uniref:AP-1 complex subunit sigma-1 n=1 Tax=Tuber aestivum TaxID=59557 RepID=A0A292PTF6_9PEZI|nr:unnamed protein product [Tuber aestivum]
MFVDSEILKSGVVILNVVVAQDARPQGTFKKEAIHPTCRLTLGDVLQRLAKWFTTLSPKEKAKIVKDVTALVLARRTRMCNFLEYKGLRPFTSIHPAQPTDSKVVYRRYASLFFIAGIDSGDNELITLEIVHRYVEQMDKYYGNVCELDIIFNFQKAYFILDELLIAGELQETSKKNVLRCISQEDALEDMELGSDYSIRFSKRYIHDT